MLVDASALPEQVVDDVVISAFQSAGQRCSAQRILFVDEGCAPRVLRLLAGALAELKVGDPAEPDTDIGPVIDAAGARRARCATSRSCGRSAQADRRGAAPRPCRQLRRPGRVRARRSTPCPKPKSSARSCMSAPTGAAISTGAAVARATPATASRSASTAASRASSTSVVRARARRQHLRQPQHDRRGGRRAAVRRRRPFGHRPEGRRAALPAALRHRDER